MSMSKREWLKPGEVVRLRPEGTDYKVIRVNVCAAYLRSMRADGEGGLIPLAPSAFVYRANEDGEWPEDGERY